MRKMAPCACAMQERNKFNFHFYEHKQNVVFHLSALFQLCILLLLWNCYIFGDMINEKSEVLAFFMKLQQIILFLIFNKLSVQQWQLFDSAHVLLTFSIIFRLGKRKCDNNIKMGRCYVVRYEWRRDTCANPIFQTTGAGDNDEIV